MAEVIGEAAVQRRRAWVEHLRQISGNFVSDVSRLGAEVQREISTEGTGVLLDHLRLCGAIPEAYRHDSSEEKLYSKYTDVLVSQTFRAMGCRSFVLAQRADAADVEVFADTFSFIADAKVFRLSRTAKNQKDFKVSAMHGWKRGKPYAMVVCPIYQLPTRSS